MLSTEELNRADLKACFAKLEEQARAIKANDRVIAIMLKDIQMLLGLVARARKGENGIWRPRVADVIALDQRFPNGFAEYGVKE